MSTFKYLLVNNKTRNHILNTDDIIHIMDRYTFIINNIYLSEGYQGLSPSDIESEIEINHSYTYEDYTIIDVHYILLKAQHLLGDIGDVNIVDVVNMIERIDKIDSILN